MSNHNVQPVVGTTVREIDGETASLMETADYPVLAECMGCHGQIRLHRFSSPCWDHVPVQAQNSPA